MKKQPRSAVRFSEIGRVDCEQITVLPGILDDISESGCKIRFPSPAEVDMEKEYTIFIRLSRSDCKECLELIVSPQWMTEADSQVEIGFKFLRSPDTPALNQLIELLEAENSASDDITSLIIDTEAEMV